APTPSPSTRAPSRWQAFPHQSSSDPACPRSATTTTQLTAPGQALRFSAAQLIPASTSLGAATSLFTSARFPIAELPCKLQAQTTSSAGQTRTAEFAADL